MVKVTHDLFQIAFSHLSVREIHTGVGYDAFQVFDNALDGLHFIVQKINLTATCQLSITGFSDLYIRPLTHERLDGMSMLGRRGDNGQIAHTGQTHIQCAWYRRCGESHDIHLCAKRFHVLLVTNPETVFFIYDDQAEVFVLDVLAQ